MKVIKKVLKSFFELKAALLKKFGETQKSPLKAADNATEVVFHTS